MNNGKLSWITVVAILAVVASTGYLLFKTAPQDGGSANTAANAALSGQLDHHGGAAAFVSNEVLDSLIGKPLPDIRLSDKDGRIYAAADFKGRNTVLFFNEGLMCYPACWNQIAAFGSDPRFNSSEVQAVSVVVDSSRDWQRAVDKMPPLARAVTLFDAGARASKELGTLTTASSMHVGSLPGHTYIVVDKEGIVRYVFDDPNMTVANDFLWGKIGELE